MADEQEGQCQDFCPRINGKIPFKSNFVMFWGVEPARLSATIWADSPPGSVIYEGQHVTLDMQVISWRKVRDNVYMIEAVDDPYFWKTTRIAVSLNDPVDGVGVSALADAIYKATGWSCDGGGGKVPQIIFSGSVVEAIKLLERMAGGLATLDHVSRRIILGTVPISSAGGEVIEEGFEAGTVNDVVCYGTLLSIPKENSSAAFEVPDWGWLGMSVPVEAWELSQALPVGSNEVAGEETKMLSDSWNEQLPTGNVVYRVDEFTQEITKVLEIVFIAVTTALRQDEVLLNSSRGFSITVSYVPAGGAGVIDPTTGEIVGDVKGGDLADRLVTASNLLDAQRKATEIAGRLMESKEGGIYVIVAPDTDTDSAGYFFDFIAIVVGKVLIPYYSYTRHIRKYYENGVLTDTEVSGGGAEPEVPVPDTALISLYIRQRLLRHLYFRVDIEHGYRVKFPYAVSAGGVATAGLDMNNMSADGVMYIQLNEAPDIDTAKSYAEAVLRLLSTTRYVGVLNGSPDGATKYVEDFSGGMYRAVAYYRVGGV